MKRLMYVLLAAGLCLVISSISYAEEKDSAMGKGMKEGHGRMGQCMMMKKMMGKEMVVSGDGGVIILVGNKLLKYDSDLNLVKETEIKIDMEAMMEKCGAMMKEGSMKEGSE